MKDLEQFSENMLEKMVVGDIYPTVLEQAALARIALAAKKAKPIGIFNQMAFDIAGSAVVFSNKEAIKAGFCSENGELTRNHQPLYTTPQPAHTEQDGWKLVPIEPTEDMVINGFESKPDKSFTPDIDWEAYDAMSGCEQAAHRAKLCWAAMLASSPKLE